jgi:hypothetical protein
MRESTFGSKAPPESHFVRCPHHADSTTRDKSQIRPICKWRAKRDHLLDRLWYAMRKHFGQQTAATVPDQSHTRDVLVPDLRHTMTEARQHVLGVKDIELDAGKIRLISDALEPIEKNAQRPIAGQEARNQQNRTSVAMRHATPAKDRIPQ